MQTSHDGKNEGGLLLGDFPSGQDVNFNESTEKAYHAPHFSSVAKQSQDLFPSGQPSLLEFPSPYMQRQAGTFGGESYFSEMMYKQKEVVLLFCNESSSRETLRQFLETEQFTVRECTKSDITSPAQTGGYSAILIDLGSCDLPPEVLNNFLKQNFPDVPAIAIGETFQIKECRQAANSQIFAHVLKPCHKTELLQMLGIAVKFAEVLRKKTGFRNAFGVPLQNMELFGTSFRSEMRRKQISAFANLPGSVLIIGERGTGKLMTAQQIHQNSSRSHLPLFVVQCDLLSPVAMDALLFGYTQGALPDFYGERIGLLELADKATVYFDRISDMPYTVQVKLSRFLKEHTSTRIGTNHSVPLDVRIIAGNDINLSFACLGGTFLEELYYQLNVQTISLPTLKELTEDIPVFARSLLMQYARYTHSNLLMISNDALTKLQRYTWPGNLREFQQVIFHACANAKNTIITNNDISFEKKTHLNSEDAPYLGLAGMTIAEVERRLIVETLAANGGNRAESARQLGISEKTIYNKCKQYKLKSVL
ncbi:MAG: sigma 54-interacting transcriptional regulator [Planctomycetaceae bacterium]|nr:sigma 54-interacting transcriptional regulator [Planctomycetaceae bacterium]